MAQFPGQKKLEQLSIVIDGKGYVGMGSYDGNIQTDFWMYNPQSNSWSRVADFPFEDSSGSESLSANGRGYVATGFVTITLWEYDPSTDSWAQRGGELNANFVGYPHRVDAGFSIGDRLFYYLADESNAPNPLFEYDLISEQWINRGYPEENDYLINRNTTGFSVNSIGYIKGSEYLYKYNPILNSWEIESKGLPGYLNFSNPFVINNKAYYTGRYDGTSFEIWEYDPNYD
jgi:N-acetylneuraminic acid mutarotase